jgi:nitronate monooxygenase
MFLVSNTAMVIQALESGITAAFPALNYRTDEELRAAISEIKQKTPEPFGINLIVNQSNLKFKSQLKTCLELKPAFIITSLGNPEEVIKSCKPLGIKVFCDVTDLKYARKVEDLGADAVIAVSSDAGGHAGNMKPEELIPLLKGNLKIPVISAGGIATASRFKEIMKMGADGVSIGTVFIASDESPVSSEYKNALIQYKGKDIIMTTRLSGSALTVINTPYVQKMGTEAGFIEKLMHRHKWLKKYAKLWIAVRGMKSIENAAFTPTYKTVWCAGPAIEHINSVRPVKEIVKDLTGE